MVEVVAVGLNLMDPTLIVGTLVTGDGMPVLVEFAPAHELLDILNLDVIGIEGLDVAEQMVGKGAAVGVAWLSSLGA